MESDSFQDILRRIEKERAWIARSIFDLEDTDLLPRSGWATLHHDWDLYAKGYKDAADVLVSYVVDNDWDQYLLIFPILFLYRQYLELRLKELLFASSRLLRHPLPDNWQTHDLLQLWRDVRPKLDQIWPPSDDDSDLDSLESRLQEIERVDPRGELGRYPVDRAGRSTAPEVKSVHLEKLRKVVQGMSHFLEGASTGIYESLRARDEMLAEMQADLQGEW